MVQKLNDVLKHPISVHLKTKLFVLKADLLDLDDSVCCGGSG